MYQILFEWAVNWGLPPHIAGPQAVAFLRNLGTNASMDFKKDFKRWLLSQGISINPLR